MAIGRGREALLQILTVLSASNPYTLKKDQLLEQRRRVIEIVTAALSHRQVDLPVTFGPPDPNYLEAIRLAAGYRGENQFMRDMQSALALYGSLTPAQADAVTAPPDEYTIESLKKLGVDGSKLKYRFQAIDVRHETRRRLREEQV